MLLIHPEHEKTEMNWSLPEPEDSGEFRSLESEWRVLANVFRLIYGLSELTVAPVDMRTEYGAVLDQQDPTARH